MLTISVVLQKKNNTPNERRCFTGAKPDIVTVNIPESQLIINMETNMMIAHVIPGRLEIPKRENSPL